MNRKLQDIVGQKYGKWVVLSIAGKDQHGKDNVLCCCECGTESVVNFYSLLSGKSSSCGCSIRKNLTHKRFGKLFVESLAYIKEGRQWWSCLCDCGKQTVVSGNNLRTKNGTQSCGCLRGNPKGSDAAITILWCEYKKSARIRKLSFTLSKAEFINITSSECHYCGCKPDRIKKSKAKSAYTFNGIDRKDNFVGYELTNCLPCCYICNKAKAARSYEDFCSWISRVNKNLTKEQYGKL